MIYLTYIKLQKSTHILHGYSLRNQPHNVIEWCLNHINILRHIIREPVG